LTGEDPDSARLQLAQSTMKRVFGIEWDIAPRRGEPSISAELDRLLFEHAFADCWSRPGLDSKTRSLVTIAIAISQGNHRELRNHVAGALNAGVAAEEVVEIFIHTAAYCGVSTTAAAWARARDLIKNGGTADADAE
jgi:4-carboxymuconolactone decarboxylase